MADLTGRRLGKYEIVERLGRGGMAEVYKAYQPGMDRFVAVKVLHSHLAESDDFIVRFRREAQVVGHLRHPHIVQVIDFDVENDIYYMVMEYIKGETLKYYIQQKGPLTTDEALRISSKLADALSYAHTEGMIHRDIKPANVMFTDKSFKHPVLTDFGIARILSGGTQLTASGAFIGTPAYISPEIARGGLADERSDIYSMGVMLYEMLTGKVPYDADTPFAVIMKHVNEPLPSPRQFNINVTESVERLLLTALAKSPEERYQNAAQFRDALNQTAGILDNERPTAVPRDGYETTVANRPAIGNQMTATIGPLEDDMMTVTGTAPTGQQVARKVTRNTWLMGGAAVVALVVVVALLFVFVFNPDDSDPTVVNTNSSPEITLTATPDNSIVAQVDALIRAGDLGTALSIFNQALQHDTENGLLYIQRGEIYQLMDRNDDALKDFTQALDLGAPPVLVYEKRGLMYLKLGRYDEALADFDKLIEAAPENSLAYAGRGRAYYANGDIQAASADFNRAITLDASNSMAYVGQAQIALDNEDYLSALNDLNFALESDQLNVEAFARRGTTYLALENYEAALTDFNRALRLDKNSLEALYGRALIRIQQENYLLALTDLSNYLTLAPSADIFILRAETYLNVNQPDKAIADYEQAIALNNQATTAYLGLAVLQQDAGDNEAALLNYTRALELDNTLVTALVERGWIYFDKGDYDLAAEDFQQAVSLDEDNASALLGLADIALDMENITTALNYYGDVLEVDADNANAWFGQGVAQNILGRSSQAIESLTQALELGYENQAEVYFERGIAYQELGDDTEALLDFAESIDLDDGFPDVYFHRGLSMFNQGQMDLAIEDFNQAEVLGYTENADLYEYRALAYAAEGNHAVALEDFDRAVEANPDNLNLVYGRAVSLIATQDYERAITDLNTLIGQSYDDLSNAYLQRGIAQNGLDNDDAALADFNRAISLDDENAQAYYQRGVIHYQQGNDDEALNDFNTALSLDETIAGAYYYRGTIYTNTDNPEEAIEDFTRAIDLNFEDLHFAYLNRGVAYERLDDLNEAIRNYTRALEIDPTYARAYYNRGLAYYNIDDFDRAITNFTLAIDNNYVESGEAYYFRGLSYALQDDYETALADYNLAAENGYNTSVFYYNRGTAYQNLGQHSPAIEDFTQALNLGYTPLEFVYLNRGFSYAETGDNTRALTDYTRALDANPDYALAYNNRGFVYLDTQLHELAISDFQRALDLGYTPRYWLLEGLGDANSALGNYQEAVNYYNRAIDERDDVTSFYIGLARAHNALKNIGPALMAYDQAILLGGATATVYYERGLIFVAEENYDDAIADFSSALRLDVDFIAAYIERSQAYLAIANPDRALADLQRALTFAPSDSAVLLALGDFYYNQNAQREALDYYQRYTQVAGRAANPRITIRITQLEEALSSATPVPSNTADTPPSVSTSTEYEYVGPDVVIASDGSEVAEQLEAMHQLYFENGPEQTLPEVTALLETSPSPPLYAFRAVLYADLNRYDEMLVDGNAAIALNPEHPSGYLVLADYYLDVQYDEEKASDFSETAFFYAPDNGLVALNHVYDLADMNRTEEAIEVAKRAEELGAPIVNVLDVRAYLYEYVFDFANAARDLERLIEINEYDSELSLRLAGMYLHLNDPARALEVVSPRVAQIGNEEPHYYINAAYVAYRAENYDQAEAWVRSGLALYEDQPAAWYVLGLVARAKGEYQSALDRFARLEELATWEYDWPYYNLAYGHSLGVDIARVYRQQGDIEMALSLLNDEIIAAPSEGLPYLERADILFEQGKESQALLDLSYIISNTYDFRVIFPALQRLLELGEPVIFDTAFQLLDHSDPATASEIVDFVTERVAEPHPAWQWLQGWILAEDEQADQAKQLAESLLAENPDNPYAYMILAHYYDVQGDDDQAHENIIQAYQRAPQSAYIVLWFARLSADREEVDIALENYALAEELGGIHPRYLVAERAHYMYDLLRFDEAISYFERLPELAGQHMDIEDVLLWAGALLQTEHPEEALQLARTYDNHPIPSWIEGFYYGNLSYVALQGGDLALAREWLTRARAAESRYQAMFDYIEALIVLAEGDSQGALERLAALSEVSIYDYNYPYLNIWYGHTIAWDQARIYRGLEDYDNALASYEGLIDEYGWWYIPYVERAELYLLLDNREAAREDLRNALQRVEDPAIRAEIQQQLESLIELD